jgi:hypothetical protein
MGQTVTHRDGTCHGDVHLTCLKSWLLLGHTTCPLDRQEIDTSQVLSLTDRIKILGTEEGVVCLIGSLLRGWACGGIVQALMLECVRLFNPVMPSTTPRLELRDFEQIAPLLGVTIGALGAYTGEPLSRNQGLYLCCIVILSLCITAYREPRMLSEFHVFPLLQGIITGALFSIIAHLRLAKMLLVLPLVIGPVMGSVARAFLPADNTHTMQPSIRPLA